MGNEIKASGDVRPETWPKCGRCDGCGKIASGDEGAPWSTWMAMPVQSSLAVLAGIVKPLPCPTCGGSGKQTAEARIAVLEAELARAREALSIMQGETKRRCDAEAELAQARALADKYTLKWDAEKVARVAAGRRADALEKALRELRGDGPPWPWTRALAIIDAALAGAPGGETAECPEEGCILDADHEEPCETDLPEPAPEASGDEAEALALWNDLLTSCWRGRDAAAKLRAALAAAEKKWMVRCAVLRAHLKTGVPLTAEWLASVDQALEPRVLAEQPAPEKGT
jgi:hypothetical protein